ncbi:MAG: hypothetical protein ABI626_05725 [Sphingomicrobium sp.]
MSPKMLSSAAMNRPCSRMLDSESRSAMATIDHSSADRRAAGAAVPTIDDGLGAGRGFGCHWGNDSGRLAINHSPAWRAQPTGLHGTPCSHFASWLGRGGSFVATVIAARRNAHFKTCLLGTCAYGARIRPGVR